MRSLGFGDYRIFYRLKIWGLRTKIIIGSLGGPVKAISYLYSISRFNLTTSILQIILNKRSGRWLLRPPTTPQHLAVFRIHESGGAGEFHPHAPTDPYVTVSRH